MRKVLVFAGLLLAGLVLSQILPIVAPGPLHASHHIITLLTFTGLAFIMIRVGQEFEVDRSNLRSYGRDYFVAMTAAAAPWILVTLYFVFVLLPPGSGFNWDAWRETLLAGRFAAPTSAGVLFTMLAAAGLTTTWVFGKARILAIFDDIDTVLLLVPLNMLIVGLAWQLGVIVAVMALLLWAGWHFMRKFRIPTGATWVLGYAAALVLITEGIAMVGARIDPRVPLHLEILLPAFVLGTVMAHAPHGPQRRDDRIATIISGVFMVLVGLSLPPIISATADLAAARTFTAAQASPGWGVIAMHVLAITVISNLGKMYPLFCYRGEASFRERLAVSIAMWPRGEVGAGVLVVSLGYGIGGPVLTVAMLSLALNLMLTGVFILMVKWLIKPRVVIPAAFPRRSGDAVRRPRQGPAWVGSSRAPRRT